MSQKVLQKVLWSKHSIAACSSNQTHHAHALQVSKVWISVSIPRIVLAKKVGLRMRFEQVLEAVHWVPQLVSLELTWAGVKCWIELLSRVKIKGCTINWQTYFTVNREVFEVWTSSLTSIQASSHLLHEIEVTFDTTYYREEVKILCNNGDQVYKICISSYAICTKLNSLYIFPFHTCLSPIWRMLLMKYLNST